MKSRSFRPTADSLSPVDLLMNALAALLLITAMSKSVMQKNLKVEDAERELANLEANLHQADARIASVRDRTFSREIPLVPPEMNKVLAPFADRSELAVCVAAQMPASRDKVLDHLTRSVSSIPALRQISFWAGEKPLTELNLDLLALPREKVFGAIRASFESAFAAASDASLPSSTQFPPQAWILLLPPASSKLPEDYRSDATRLLLVRAGIEPNLLTQDLEIARHGGVILNLSP